MDKGSSHNVVQKIFFWHDCTWNEFQVAYVPLWIKGSSHNVVHIFFFVPFTVLARAGQELHQISSIVSFQEFAIDRPNPQSILINNLVSSIGVDFLNHIRAVPFGEELAAHAF